MLDQQGEDLARHMATTEIFEALTLLTPREIDRRRIRLGPNRDGGYIYADGITPSHNILSFGVGYTCEFENELGACGNKVHMFDPTVEAPLNLHQNCTFHKRGVAGRTSLDRTYLSISDALDAAGYSKSSPTILKMDVEGAEFDSIALAEPETLRLFDQIALEIHWLSRLTDPAYRAAFTKMISALNAQFTLFHVHANNCAGVHVISNYNQASLGPIGGLTVADVLELSYIRTDLIGSSRPNASLYPTELDFPNSEHWPDHILTFYPFVPGSDGLVKDIRDLFIRNQEFTAANSGKAT